jgi:hypothetical protein
VMGENVRKRNGTNMQSKHIDVDVTCQKVGYEILSDRCELSTSVLFVYDAKYDSMSM